MSFSRAFSSNRRRCVGAMASAFAPRGYSDNDIQAVLGGNFHRLLGSSWTSQPRDVEKKS
jgi:hypothetical protein